MTVTYQIDFHVPIREIENAGTYPLEVEQTLTVDELVARLAEHFSTMRLLMSYGRGGRLPVAVLVDGRALQPQDIVPEGALVKIIGAVAGGQFEVLLEGRS